MKKLILLLSIISILTSCNNNCNSCKEPSAYTQVFGDSAQAVLCQAVQVTALNEVFTRTILFNDVSIDIDQVKNKPLNIIKNYTLLVALKDAGTCNLLKTDFRFSYDISKNDILNIKFTLPDTVYTFTVTDTSDNILSEANYLYSFNTAIKPGADFLKVGVELNMHSDTVGRVSKVEISSCDAVCAGAVSN